MMDAFESSQVRSREENVEDVDNFGGKTDMPVIARARRHILDQVKLSNSWCANRHCGGPHWFCENEHVSQNINKDLAIATMFVFASRLEVKKQTRTTVTLCALSDFTRTDQHRQVCRWLRAFVRVKRVGRVGHQRGLQGVLKLVANTCYSALSFASGGKVTSCIRHPTLPAAFQRNTNPAFVDSPAVRVLSSKSEGSIARLRQWRDSRAQRWVLQIQLHEYTRSIGRLSVVPHYFGPQ